MTELTDSIDQACAELAFAKSMGFTDWNFDQEPVPGIVRGFHVIWQREHDAELPVPYDAKPDDIYVLVTGETPTFEVHGWITGRDARRLGTLRTR
jgi:hypothetical protein